MRFVVLLCAVSVVSCCGSPRMKQVPKLAEATELVWLGIDYSRVKMVGIGAFNDPGAIFPRMLENWNGLFATEMLGELLDRVKLPVRADVDAVLARNRLATTSQIIESVSLPGGNLTPDDVARMVKGYELRERGGVGLVFVMDVMLKHEERACLYTTFVDMATRTVIDTKRVCHPAGGFGFRNYWFSPVKEAVRAL